VQSFPQDQPKEDASGPAGGGPPRFRRNLLLTFCANIAILALTVATGTLNARLLGPSGRGELAAIQTLPQVLGMIALLGLPSAVGYFSAQRPAEARTFTFIAASIFLVASVPAILAGYFLMPWVLHQQSPSVIHDARIFLVFVALHVAQFPYMALQGTGGFGIWNLLRLAPNLAMLTAILTAAGTRHLTSGALAKTYLVLFSLIIPIGYGILWRRTRRVEVPRTSYAEGARELLRYGLPSALMIPAGLLNLQLDQLMMAAWLPSHLLGLYAVSVSWSGLMSPAFGALGSMVFPTLAAARDPDSRRAIVARSTRLAVLGVVILGAGLAACTPLLLPLFFGRSFAPAVPVALILVAASMVLNLSGLCGEILRGLGAPRWPLFSQIAGLPVTVGLLLLLLPRWSIMGAGVSSLLSYLVTSVVSFWGVGKLCRLSMRDLLLPRPEDYRTLLGAVHGILARLSSLKNGAQRAGPR
jgi:O-antigen/teichoic acid export membrane protein